MINYIIRRVIIALFMLIGIAFVSFVVIQLPPGDVATNYKAFLLMQPGVKEEDAERQADLVRERYGLDQPLPIQFVTWIKGMVTEGKFGWSFAYRKDVGELIAERLPKTIALALMCHLISTVVGVSLGIYVATRKYGIADNVTAILAFILGIMWLIIFGLQNAIRPAITSGIIALVSSLILLGHGLSVKRIVARTPEECWGDLPELELEDSEK